MIRKEKEDALIQEMQRLGIKEEDILEKFLHASGSGGQKVNKTSSKVYLKHLPTGIEVSSEQDRKQVINRFLARRALVEKYKEKVLLEKSQATIKAEKIRKQKLKKAKRNRQKKEQE